MNTYPCDPDTGVCLSGGVSVTGLARQTQVHILKKREIINFIFIYKMSISKNYVHKIFINPVFNGGWAVLGTLDWLIH